MEAQIYILSINKKFTKEMLQNGKYKFSAVLRLRQHCQS